VKTILIVDDSRTTIEVVKIHLMARGYDFVVASEPRDGLEIASRVRPALIISDFAMPTTTGTEFCALVRRSPVLQHTPFVMVTSKRDDGTKRAAFAAGASGFLTKPIDGKRLEALVSRLVELRPASS
jgi:twitching motility two-component system response regulator PilG